MYLVDRVRYGIPLHDPPTPQVSSGGKVAQCFDENTGEYVAQAVYRNLLDQKKYYSDEKYLTTVPQDETTIFNTSSTLAPCDQKSAYYQSALWLYVSARLLAGVGLMDSADAAATLAKEYTREGNGLTPGRRGESDEDVASIAFTANTQLGNICGETTQRIEGIKTCALLLQFPLSKLSLAASSAQVGDRVQDTEASRPEGGGGKTMKDIECLFRLLGAGVFLPTKAQGCYSSWTIWAVRAGMMTMVGLYAVNTITPLLELARGKYRKGRWEKEEKEMARGTKV
jgi:hypothetical protein